MSAVATPSTSESLRQRAADAVKEAEREAAAYKAQRRLVDFERNADDLLTAMRDFLDVTIDRSQVLKESIEDRDYARVMFEGLKFGYRASDYGRQLFLDWECPKCLDTLYVGRINSLRELHEAIEELDGFASGRVECRSCASYRKEAEAEKAPTKPSKPKNPSAFPSSDDWSVDGMSLRDYFAAHVFRQAYDGTPFEPPMPTRLAGAAQRAYEIADALLKAREA